MVDGGGRVAVGVGVLAVARRVMADLVVAGVVVAGGGQVRRRPVPAQAPLAQDDGALDDVGQLAHLVQDRQQRDPLRAQRLQDAGQGPARVAVDAGQRLVEDEQLGGAHEGAGDEDPLGLAAGEDLDVVVGALGQAHGLQSLQGPLARAPPPVRQGAAGVEQPGADHLQGGGGHARRRPHALGHVAHAPPGHGGAAGDVAAEEAHGPRADGQQAQDGAHERGLARAVGAQEGDRLARLDAQVDARQDEARAQDDGQVLDLDGGRVGVRGRAGGGHGAFPVGPGRGARGPRHWQLSAVRSSSRLVLMTPA